MERRRRDLAISNLAIDSKLRGCDPVRLRVDDVFAAGRVRDRTTVVQQKTGRPVQCEITEQTRTAIAEWLAAVGSRRGAYLFPSRFRERPHLSTRQYARIVHRWVDRAGLDSSAYGTHSMRRTKPTQIYKKTGNLRAVQLLLGHTKLESTVRYLGIEVMTPSRSRSRSSYRPKRRRGLAPAQGRNPCLGGSLSTSEAVTVPHHPVDRFCPIVAVHRAEPTSHWGKTELRGGRLIRAVPHPNIVGGHPSTAASAIRGSTPWRTSALDQIVWSGGR